MIELVSQQKDWPEIFVKDKDLDLLRLYSFAIYCIQIPP